jgi:hypothetical protein
MEGRGYRRKGVVKVVGVVEEGRIGDRREVLGKSSLLCALSLVSCVCALPFTLRTSPSMFLGSLELENCLTDSRTM